MLVLTRKTGQKITISGPATVQVCSIRGDHARLGITAERDVTILRSELAEQEPQAQQEPPAPVKKQPAKRAKRPARSQ